MQIKKDVNGYTIEVSYDEYNTLMEALEKEKTRIEKKFGIAGEVTGYGRLYREMQEAKQRYLTKEEAASTVNCLVCKNCLPTFYRENGKMCKLKECKFEHA